MTRVVPTIGQAVPGNFETAAFWNANVQAGLNFLLNPPLFAAYHSGTQSVANNDFTALMILDTETIDTEGGHSTTTNSQRYTCQVAGLYRLNGGILWPAGGTGARGAKFYFNGSVDVPGSENVIPPSATIGTFVSCRTSYVRLAVGDYVALGGFQNSGAALSTATPFGGSNTSLSAEWVSA